jgi:hypothetical protein
MKTRLVFLLSLLFAGALPAEPRPRRAEVLYNGIQLPSPWPPQPASLPADPVTPYYLTNPPAVIPIDVGRQLFVDDFLIEQTTLARTYHLPTYHPASPVLVPDQPWEKPANAAMAMPYSDGMAWDPQARVFRMWYGANYPLNSYVQSICYATSTDGLVWNKPSLGVVPGTNIVYNDPKCRDSASVLEDPAPSDPGRRFVLFRCFNGGATIPDAFGLAMHFSPDGITWSQPPVKSGSCGDRSTVFYNPFRKVWAYSLRHGWSRPRKKRYWERADLHNGPMWTNIGDPPYWCAADSLDKPRPDLGTTPELYHLDCVPYESLMLGLFTIWYGVPVNRPKINEVQVAYSRDGWSWVRPDRRAFCGVSETPGSWNYGNVTSVGNGLFVMGDELWLYVSGRKGDGTNIDAGGSTGLAVLRRDGFASVDAGATEGTLTTRTVRFAGKHLFVNVDDPGGELRVEVLTGGGQVIAPFSKANGVPVAANRTLQRVTWTGASDLSAVAGQDVRFRFHLRNGKLYSFWVSPDPTGASYGYVTGPAFTGPTDTVGDGGAAAPPPAPAPAPASSGGDSDDTRCGCASARPGAAALWLAALALLLLAHRPAERPERS